MASAESQKRSGGCRVVVDRGLGGRTLSELRPRIAVDYRTSNAITHDYDRQVLSEGVRTLLAVPVIVEGNVRGVLYGARRSGDEPGNVAVGPVVRAAQELGRELAVVFDGAASGRTELLVRRGALAAGTYLLRVSGETTAATQTITFR